MGLQVRMRGGGQVGGCLDAGLLYMMHNLKFIGALSMNNGQDPHSCRALAHLDKFSDPLTDSLNFFAILLSTYRFNSKARTEQ